MTAYRASAPRLGLLKILAVSVFRGGRGGVGCERTPVTAGATGVAAAAANCSRPRSCKKVWNSA